MMEHGCGVNRLTCLFLIVVLIALPGFSLASEEQGIPRDQKAAAVALALEMLNEQWDDYQIIDARIITIKENDIELFKDVDCIVEFVLFTNYFGTAPYYCNAGIYDTVSIYRDGHAEINRQNPFYVYRTQTFITDFSGIIACIENVENV